MYSVSTCLSEKRGMIWRTLGTQRCFGHDWKGHAGEGHIATDAKAGKLGTPLWLCCKLADAQC
jgi:hypothetical protein